MTRRRPGRAGAPRRRAESQVSPESVGHPPADDGPGEHVGHGRHIGEARPGGHLGYVGHPQLVGGGRREGPLDQVGGTLGGRVGHGGAPTPAPDPAGQAHLSHQAFTVQRTDGHESDVRCFRQRCDIRRRRAAPAPWTGRHLTGNTCPPKPNRPRKSIGRQRTLRGRGGAIGLSCPAAPAAAHRPKGHNRAVTNFNSHELVRAECLSNRRPI